MNDIINHFKRRNPDPAVQAAAFALVADVLQDRRITEASDIDATRAEMDRAALAFAAAASDAGRVR
jgi:hypothetical protein